MATNTAAADLNGLRDWSPTVVRVALGIVFVLNGVGKIANVGPEAMPISGFAGFLGSLGVPAPGIFAWIVAITELVGGLFLLLGFLTRIGAAALAVDMFVAMILVHVPNGFASSNGGYEYTMVLTLVCISLILSGPGRLSVERSVFGAEILPKTLGLQAGRTS